MKSEVTEDTIKLMKEHFPGNVFILLANMDPSDPRYHREFIAASSKIELSFSFRNRRCSLSGRRLWFKKAYKVYTKGTSDSKWFNVRWYEPCEMIKLKLML